MNIAKNHQMTVLWGGLESKAKKGTMCTQNTVTQSQSKTCFYSMRNVILSNEERHKMDRNPVWIYTQFQSIRYRALH